MSEVIYKYKLDPISTISLPLCSKVLTAGIQNGEAFLWVKINQDIKEQEVRNFISFGTGHKIEIETKDFINTLFFENGLVFHVFEYWL